MKQWDFAGIDRCMECGTTLEKKYLIGGLCRNCSQKQSNGLYPMKEKRTRFYDT